MIQTKIINSYKELSKLKSKGKIIGLCHGANRSGIRAATDLFISSALD